MLKVWKDGVERREKELWLKAFGAHVKKLTTERGISGAEFARMLEIDQPNLTRIEKGRVNISIFLIKKMCNALQLKIHEFFKMYSEE